MIHRIVIYTLVIFWVTGCAGLLSSPRQLAEYDFGFDVEPVLSNRDIAPATVAVLAPVWLRSSAMQYRLEWNQPARRRDYAESRWVAAPAEMLALSLKRALQAGEGRQGCRLVVEMDEFVQVFDQEDKSRVELLVQAKLFPAHSKVPLMSRRFKQFASASSANAEGAVAASQEVVTSLAAALGEWLTRFDQEQKQSGDHKEYCSRL